MGDSARESDPSGTQAAVSQRATALIAEALIREGLGSIVDHRLPESAYFQPAALRAGVVVIGAIVASLLWAVAMLTGVLWGVALAAAWVLLAYVTSRATTRAASALGNTLLVAVVLGVLVWQVIAEGLGPAALTFGLPILVGSVWLVLFQLDFGALGRTVPFLFALALFILLVPLFTDDVWLVASRLTARQFVWVALAFVCPVLVAVALRLRGDAGELAEDDPARIGTPDEVEKSLRNNLEFQLALDRVWTEGKMGDTDQRWGNEQAEHIEYAVSALRRGLAPPLSAAEDEGGRKSPPMAANVVDGLRRTLVRQSLKRLLPTAIIISLAAMAYMYLLANLAIKAHAARTWTQKHIPTIDVPLIHLWGGPYVHVAVLLGLAAAGIFLALVLTDERYFDPLARALVGKPGMRAAALLVPYALLTHTCEPDAEGSSESGEDGAPLR